MKKYLFPNLVILLVFIVNFSSAQQSEEPVIRDLENLEKEAILKGDTTLLLKLLSPRVIVHNPENTFVNLKQIIERVKTGKINYSGFERIIEKITFVENIAIVMGKEVITPQGETVNTGKTVTRRFTNIWMKNQDGWLLTARQATIISVK